MTRDLNRLSAEKIMHYEVGDSHFSGEVWVRERERPYQEWWLFNPLVDLNQCFMVVERMVKKGQKPYLDFWQDGSYGVGFKPFDADDPTIESFHSNTLNEAILTAALDAAGA